MTQQKLDYTKLRTDLGRSVLSVKCVQTGVNIDYPLRTTALQ